MIGVLNLPKGDIFEVCPELKEVKCLFEFSKKSGGLPVRETIIYIVLLYTKDSPLNKKPIQALSDRRVRAATMAGLNPESKLIQEKVFGMGSEAIDDCIVKYLIQQSSYAWSDRCAIEAQMDENLRIRFKPIETETGKGKDKVQKNDKDIIDASTKKYLLTEHFSKYKDNLKKLDAEIFLDHDDKRDHAIRKKTSLESLIK